MHKSFMLKKCSLPTSCSYNILCLRRLFDNLGMCLCYVGLKKKKDPKTAFKSQIEHDLNYEKRIVTENEEGNKPKMTSVAQVVDL